MVLYFSNLKALIYPDKHEKFDHEFDCAQRGRIVQKGIFRLTAHASIWKFFRLVTYDCLFTKELWISKLFLKTCQTQSKSAKKVLLGQLDVRIAFTYVAENE